MHATANRTAAHRHLWHESKVQNQDHNKMPVLKDSMLDCTIPSSSFLAELHLCLLPLEYPANATKAQVLQMQC